MKTLLPLLFAFLLLCYEIVKNSEKIDPSNLGKSRYILVIMPQTKKVITKKLLSRVQEIESRSMLKLLKHYRSMLKITDSSNL